MSNPKTIKRGKNLFIILDKYIKIYNKQQIEKDEFVPLIRSMREYCTKLNKYFKSPDFDIDSLVDYKATVDAVELFLFEQVELNRFYTNKPVWNMYIHYLSMYHEMSIVNNPDNIDADEISANIYSYITDSEPEKLEENN